MVETILIFSSFVLAAGSILSFFSLQRGVGYLGRTRLAYLLVWMIGLGGTFLFAVIRIGGGEYDPVIGETGGGGFIAIGAIWFKRIVTALSLVTAVGVIAHFSTGKDRVLKTGTGLISAYFIFIIASFVLSSLFGTVPAFVPQLFYGPIMLLALFMLNDIPLKGFVYHVKLVIGVVLVGSLLLCVKLDWAFSYTAQGILIPGLSGRLAGLTAHPNQLGPLAVIYLLLEWYQPSRAGIRIFFLGAALLTLLLAQSKTAWIAAIVAVGVLAAYYLISSRFLSEKGSSEMRFRAALILSVAGVFSVIAFAGVLFSDELLIRSSFRYSALASLSTFTGRTEIWEITLQLWERNPWFGYGPTLWGQEFRAKFLMLYVGQAHNQVIQTLGDSGLVGLAGLLIYLGTLVVYAIRAASYTRGISLALVSFLLLRCGTETPIRTLAVIDATFFMHFMIFGFLLFAANDSLSDSRRR